MLSHKNIRAGLIHLLAAQPAVGGGSDPNKTVNQMSTANLATNNNSSLKIFSQKLFLATIYHKQQSKKNEMFIEGATEATLATPVL